MISKWIGKGVLLLACLAGLPMGSAYAQSVSAPTQMVVVDDTQYNLVSSFASAVSVSGFDPVAVRVEVPQGSLRITTTTGLTAPPSASSSDWAGASSIYFEGALVDVNAALASLEIRGSGQTISLAAHHGYIYGASTGSSYEIVTNAKNWHSAKAEAETRTLNGSQGYLATITSQVELDFIKNNFSWSQFVWLGGSDTTTEGEWFWVTGPEAGTQFYSTSDPSLITFANFDVGEPNNWRHQDYLGFSKFYLLNDKDRNDAFPYIVEYSTIYEITGSFSVTTQAIVNANAAATAALAAQQAAIAQAETDLKAGLDNHLKHKLASQLKGVTRSQSNQFAMHQAWKNKQGQVAEFLKPQFYLHSEDDNSHLDTEAKLKLAFQNGEGHLWTMQAHTSSKRLKNGMAEAHLSTRFAFDRDLDEDIAQRLNFGFETTKERGGNDFSLRTRTNSILSGYGFSQRFSETLYFNLYLEGWYSTIQTKYDRDTASGEASLKMLEASASAQLQGRYQISDMVRLELMAGFSKAKDVIQNKNIHLNVPLTQSLSQILISEPESTRWSIEPTFHFVLLPDKNKLLREMDVTPKYSCENMSSTKSAQVCAGGFRAEYQIKTPDDVKKSYFYFDYENLSNGPVHEYGLALNAQF